MACTSIAPLYPFLIPNQNIGFNESINILNWVSPHSSSFFFFFGFWFFAVSIFCHEMLDILISVLMVTWSDEQNS